MSSCKYVIIALLCCMHLNRSLNKKLSYISPEVESYYDFQRELYDVTFGREKNASRETLEKGMWVWDGILGSSYLTCCGSSGWKSTNVPSDFAIPPYNAKLDRFCPIANKVAPHGHTTCITHVNTLQCGQMDPLQCACIWTILQAQGFVLWSMLCPSLPSNRGVCVVHPGQF